ncbi:DUF4417 domain-containing protein [Streptococcus fryi]
MSKIQSNRGGCKDVFNAFLVENAEYAGDYEIPVISSYEGELPISMVPFSKRRQCSSNNWICFYEDDVNFEGIWKSPKQHLETLKSYDGVILPDFSIYRDMPLAMQIWNIYRSRAIGTWLQENEISVIPNIRWGDERTYDIACDGLSKHSVIAVGSHGLMKDTAERQSFIKGLDYIINRLEPHTILVYGAIPNEVFQYPRFLGIEIVQYPSYTSLIFQGGIA